jgi:hypothetical protein
MNQSCDEHYHYLRDDLDWNSNRETKFAVGAPLVDGDFNKPIEFSYQKAVPGGRSLKVLACSTTRPIVTSLASCGSMTALSPVMALPK